MYRLKRLLHSVRAFSSTAGGPYRKPKRLLIRGFSSTSTSTSTSTVGIDDDLVYVGREHKICGKDEIEAQIRRNGRITTYQTKKRNVNVNGRKVLPPKLQSRNVARLTCDSTAAGGICDVFLVGSDHGCPESWREVENVIRFLKLEVVFLELCSRRLDALTCDEKVPSMGEMLDLWKNNEDPFWILTTWFNAKCRNKFRCPEHNEWGGGEFRTAYKQAMKYGGKVILGDRPIHIAIRRQLAIMSPWVYCFDPLPILAAEDLPEKREDLDPYLLAEVISKKLPAYAETHIMERDRYMSAKLLEVAREHRSVVAVVGQAHLGGIQKNWKQPVEMKEILSIPAKNIIGTIGKLLNTFGAMVAFLSLSPSLRHKVVERIADCWNFLAQ